MDKLPSVLIKATGVCHCFRTGQHINVYSPEADNQNVICKDK